MAEGKLPHLSELRQRGSYQRLRTTFPALSPVAWSTFATGVNPARHNIFDFLNRNLKTYMPELSSARVYPPRRVLNLGRLRVPLSRPYVEMRRKSQPFWKILGEQQIGSTIIRVPITFPPDRFQGRILSAMATPDLRGTQGSFSFFSTRLETATYESGSRYPLKRIGNVLEGSLEGPQDFYHHVSRSMQLSFRVALDSHLPELRIDGQAVALKPGEYSPWIRFRFRAGLGATVNGIARFLVTETDPEFSMYVTPVQIDPEKPALPISHPPFYAAYLAKILGTYSTLGMAEDTWALNEGVIDEQAFLKQAWQLMAEREAMFRNALEKTPRGVVACVFDTSDRVQHMFYRYVDPQYGSAESRDRFGTAIEDLYSRVDALVGLAAAHVDESTVLFVLSDHGFCSFRRGVNLNTWLLQNGYLHLKDGASMGGAYFEGVDWSRTRAYALGFGGLYFNLAGRESSGIVQPGAEAAALAAELKMKLTGLRDDACGTEGIRAVYEASTLYNGPYAGQAPDLIIGFSDGYRISWDAAIGKIGSHVFENNNKAWSGDHAVDPHLVPGVLFCNRRVGAADPGIEDLAPTALELFGIPIPSWMEGKPLFSHAG
jgi:predicted AlkP superfamily phosphohydrolase/phosphomutase